MNSLHCAHKEGPLFFQNRHHLGTAQTEEPVQVLDPCWMME